MTLDKIEPARDEMPKPGMRSAIAGAFAVTGLGFLTLEHWDHFSGRDILLSALFVAAVLLLIPFPRGPSTGAAADEDEG